VGGGGHHRYSGAVDGNVEHVGRPRWGQNADTPVGDGPRLGAGVLLGERAVGFGGALDPFGRQRHSGEVSEQARGFAERLRGRRERGHPAQPRRQ
jgi:hypothetical protein